MVVAHWLRTNTGTLTLTGNNTYSGGTTLNAGAGTLVITGVTSAGTGAIVQTDANSILRFDTTGTITNNMTLYNFESLRNLTLSGDINSQDATYKIATGKDTTLSGNITGTGKLSQIGADDANYRGTLTLSGDNDFEGDTEVDSVLNVGSATALSAQSKLKVNNGGMVKLNGFDSTVASLEGNGTIQGSATLTAGDESNATFSGVLEDGTGGGLSLAKGGSGTMTLSGANTFTGATTVTSGTLEVAGSGVLGGGNYGSSITVGSGGMLKLSTDANQTLSGALSGAGDLVKQGTGTLTLSGTNSFTGTTTASAGVLVLNSSGTAITGDSDTSTFDLEVSGGTVRVDADDQLADDVDISISSGTFDLNGSSESIDGLANSGGVFTTGIGGTLTVLGNTVTWSSGTNTISAGGTVQDTNWDVSGGTNTVDGDGGTTSGGGTLHVQSGGTGFEFTGSGTPNITLSSDNTAAGRMLLEGKLSVASTYTGTGATITSGGSGSQAGYIDLGAGTRTFEINDSANAADDLTVSAVITNGSITKTGLGTLVLSGANTYTKAQIGATNQVGNAGTISIEHNTALGTGQLDYGSGGTLDLGVTGLTVANNVFVGNRTDGSDYKIQLDLAGTATGELTGFIDIRKGSPGVFVAEVGADDTLTFSGLVKTGAGGGAGLNKIGAGTLVLTNDNTYKGNTTVNAGTLKVTSQTALGTVVNATTVADGATLELNYVPANNTSPIEENITLNGAGVGGTEGALKITGTGAGNELGNNTITLGSDATINTQARFDTNSTITDNGNGYTLTKTGSNYSHQMNASGVTADFTHLVIAEGDYWAGPLSLPSGVGTSVTVANGAQLTTWGAQIIANNPDITFEGGSTFRTDRANDTMSINGTMTLNGAVTFSGPQATHTANISSDIGGTGSLTKTGPNTTNLSGANTYTGLTTVNSGTLKAGSGTAFTDTGQLTVSGGTFDLNGFDAAFTQTNSGAGTITNSVAGVKTFDTGIVAGTLANLITGDTALRVTNNNGVFDLTNTSNNFTGGITLAGTASGTRMRFTSADSFASMGSGAITIGESATDKAGIYIVSGNNTLTNDIIFNTVLGTDRPGIRVDTTNVTFSGDITANQSDALFSTNSTGTATLTGQVTGTNGLTLDNTFGTSITVTLNNAAENNDYAGDTTIAGTKGTLELGRSNQIANGAGKGNVVNNGTLNLNGFSDTINGLSGSGTVDGVSGTATLTLGDGDATASFSGIITDSAGTLALTKIGTGTQTLTGVNTYTGGTTVDGGTLKLTGSGRIGNGGLTVNNGGTLSVATNAFNSLGGAITVNEGGTLSTDSTGQNAHNIGAIAINGGTLTSSGNSYSEGNWIFNDDVTVGGSALSTISGLAVGSKDGGGIFNVADSVSGAGTDLLVSAAMVDAIGGSFLTKTGAGTMTLSGTNTYTGANDVQAGTLRAGSTTAFGDNVATTVASGAVLELDGNNNSIGSLAGAGTVENASATAATLTTGGDNTSTTFSGVLQDGTGGGALSLTKTGSGTLTLNATGNTYSGGTTIKSGTLISGGPNDINGLGSGDVLLGDTSGSTDATLQLDSFSSTTYNNNIIVQSGNTGTMSILKSGNAPHTGIVTLGTGTEGKGVTLAQIGNAAWVHEFEGVIQDNASLTGTAGNVTIGSNNIGRVKFSGTSSNTYTGDTIVEGGTLELGKTGGATAIAGNVTFGNGTSGQPYIKTIADNQFGPTTVMDFVNPGGQWTRFDLQGTTQTLAGITSTGIGGIIQNREGAGGGNSTLIVDNATAFTFAGHVRDGGSGTLSLVKEGAGTLTLEAYDANTNRVFYTGTTTVNEGRLVLDSLYESDTFRYQSDTTVNAGAVLELAGAKNWEDGTTGWDLTLNNATLDKTNTGYNTFNNSNVTVSGASTINITNDGSNNQLFIGGNGGTGLTGSGTLTVNNTGTTTTGLTLRNSGNATRFDGDMIVNGGVLNVGNGTSLTLDNTDLTLNGAILDMDGAFANTAADASVKSLAGDTTSSVVLGAQTLTLGTNNGDGADFAGVIGGTGALTKAGTGTQTFSGANTYTGATAINAGTLNVNGSSSTASYTIASGATLNLNNATQTSPTFYGDGTLAIDGGSFTNFNFGDDTTGLGSGTVTLSNTVSVQNLKFGKASGDITLSGGTISIAGGDNVIQASSGGGSVTNTHTIDSDITKSSGRLQFGTQSTTNERYIVNGVLSGGFNLDGRMVNNSGVLELNGLNTFTGSVSIVTGQINANTFANSGVASSLGAGSSISMGGGGGQNPRLVYTGSAATSTNRTLTVNANGIVGIIAQDGALDLAGTVRANSGATTYNLYLSGTADTGTNEVSGVMQDNGSGTLAVRVNNTGATGVTGEAGYWVFSGANTYTGSTLIQNSSTLVLGNGGTTGSLSTSSAITVDSGSSFVVNQSDTVSEGVDFSGNLAGAGDVTMAGSGTLELLVDSTGHSGDTIVNNGTLRLVNTADLKGMVSDNFFINNGSILEIESSVGGSNRSTLLNDSIFTFDSNGGGNIDFVSGNHLAQTGTSGTARFVTTGGAQNTITSSGGFINPQGSGNHVTFDVADGTDDVDLDVSVNITNGTWRKDGAGTLSITNDISRAGGVININAGTFEIGSSGRIASAGAATGEFANAINNSGIFKHNSTLDQTVSGVISGTGAVVKDSTGTLSLTGQNTYTGSTTVSGGILSLTTGQIYSNLGWQNRSITINGGGLVEVGGWADGDVTNSQAGFGQLSFAASNIVVDNATIRYTGSSTNGNSDRGFTIGAGGATLEAEGSNDFVLNQGRGFGVVSSAAGTLTLSGSQNGTFNLQLGGSGGLVKDDAGTWTVNNSNTYTGGTTLNTGTLVLGSATAAGTGTITQTDDTSTLRLNTGGTIANDISLFNLESLQSVTLSGDITANNATYDIASGTTTTISGDISGGGGTIKEGLGTLVLSGTNTYTGNTEINAGTLSLSSSTSNNNIDDSVSIIVGADGTFDVSAITASGGFQLANGQTLAGTGDVIGATEMTAGSNLSAGDGGVGELSFLTSLDVASASTGSLLFDLGSAGTGDLIDVTGQLNIGNGLLDLDDFVFTNLGATSVTGTYTWNLFQANTFDFANLGTNTTDNIFGSYSATLAISGGNVVQLTMFVPEPSSTALLGLGGLMLALRRKRSAA